MLSIFPGGGQQLIEGDEYHNAGYSRKNNAEDRVRHDGHQQEPADQSAKRFRQAGQEGIAKGLFPGTGGLVDGHGHGDALGNVVDGDGHHDGDGDGGGLEGGNKGS